MRASPRSLWRNSHSCSYKAGTLIPVDSPTARSFQTTVDGNYGLRRDTEANERDKRKVEVWPDMKEKEKRKTEQPTAVGVLRVTVSLYR